MDPTQFMIQKELDQYRSSLAAWERQVTAQRTPFETARAAALQPARGHLIASLPGLTNSPRERSISVVGRILDERLASVASGDPQLANIMRAIQGHWPDAHRKLGSRIRAESLKTQIHSGPGDLEAGP